MPPECHQPDAANYTYAAIGNLIQDKAEGITNIEWTVYGKIKSITKSNGAKISYTYDASGNRISQVNTKGSTVKRTYYVRDASGNIMSIYSMTDTLKQKEINLYGSSRLGIYSVDIDVQNCNVALPEITKFTRGNKSYELSTTVTLTLNIATGKKVGIKSFSFYNRVSNSGYRHWKMYINGIEVGDNLLYYPATGGIKSVHDAR